MRLWKRCFVWLGRIGHRRGFGVQSPTDYRFVCDVILERLPYYKYRQLASDFPDLDGMARKRCQLFFRLANYCQARTFLHYGSCQDASLAYVKAGCERVLVRDGAGKGAQVTLPETPFLACAPAAAPSREWWEWLLAAASDDSVIVVEGIKEGKKEREAWRWLTENDRASVTYDLYDCGIIITAKRRYKKNYIINF